LKPTCVNPQFFSPKRGCQCVDRCQPQDAPFEGCNTTQVKFKMI
jgi:hypothetical protein